MPKKSKKVSLNDFDVSKIAQSASVKGGWVDIKIVLPDGETLQDTRNAKQPKDYIVRLFGHVEIEE